MESYERDVRKIFYFEFTFSKILPRKRRNYLCEGNKVAQTVNVLEPLNPF